jgi:foldase protein PrsA
MALIRYNKWYDKRGEDNLKMGKKIIVVLLAALMILATAGCGLIQVDPEKDMERVVIELKDEEILKREFNSYLTYHKMVYELNSYTLPEGDDLDLLKEDILNTISEIKVLKNKALELELEIDSEGLDDEIGNYLDSFLETMGEDRYSSFLAENHMDEESFEEFFRSYLEDIRYANAAIENFNSELNENKEEELSKVVMTLDGEEILKDEFYYHLSKLEFDYYVSMGSGLPSDQESLTFIYDELLSKISESRVMYKQALDEGVEVTEDEIDKEVENLESYFATYFDQEALEGFLSDYYLSLDDYNRLLEEEAARIVHIEKLQKKLETGVTVTSDEISKYYEDKKSSYDTSSISAKHILTESESYARELMDSISDAASFEEAFEKAQDDENVREASDLGEFTHNQMVTEFADAAFALGKGEVIQEPVQSQYGYHIIYVYDKNEAEIPTLEDKTDEIRQILIAGKVTDEYMSLKDQAMEDADISKEEVKDPFLTYLEELKEEYKVKTYPSRL